MSRPSSAPTAIAASALRTLCSPSSGIVNSPRSCPPRETWKRVPPARADSMARHSAPSARPNVWTRLRAVAARAAASGLSAPSSTRPLRGTRLTSRRKAEPHLVEIGVDVGVIELDVVDDGDVRQVLQELRGLVEVGAVVLVAFDHERFAPCRSDSSRRRRRNCGRCRRSAPSGRRRQRSAATRQSRSSWSCRACRQSRSSARPTATGREWSPAATHSAGPHPAPLRAPRCRARWRCRPRPDRSRR